MRQQIAIFGGTFDPVHLGHIKAVEMVCKQFSDAAVPLTKVHWVLSARPPHKEHVSASIEHRFKMLQLALADNEIFIADDTEITRQQKSYTIDTVATFKQCFPQASIVVIIGGDSLVGLPEWHGYQELVNSVNWVVMNRPGYPLKLRQELSQELASRVVKQPQDLPQNKGGKIWIFEQPEFVISSTALRAELTTQKSDKLSKEFLCDAVFNYIKAQQLYKIRAMKPEQIKDQVIEALEDVKGQDLRVIDIRDIADFADYMIVASGTSDTHVKALARNASDSLRKQGVKPVGEDGADVGEWVLVDFGDVVLHVMRPEVREFYDLEKLWDEEVRAIVKKHREEQES